MNNKYCRDCKHYETRHELSFGWCCAFPPQYIGIQNFEKFAAYDPHFWVSPTVLTDDCCGQWMNKDSS